MSSHSHRTRQWPTRVFAVLPFADSCEGPRVLPYREQWLRGNLASHPRGIRIIGRLDIAGRSGEFSPWRPQRRHTATMCRTQAAFIRA